MQLWFYSKEDWFSISHSKWKSLSLSLSQNSYQINYEQTLGETQSLIDDFLFFFSTLLLKKKVIETNKRDIQKFQIEAIS